MSWRQQEHQHLCFRYWYYLTNFWCNNWWSIIEVVERLGYWEEKSLSMLWWLFRQILEFQKKILLDRKLCYRRSVCTYISIPTIYMYKVESIECIVWLSYQTPCWSVLEVWKFKLEKLSLTNWIYSLQKSISKLIFADYTGSKNPVCRTWFFQIDFSEIKYRSTGGKSYNIGASLLCLRFNVCLNGYHKRNQLTREQEIYIPSHTS